MEHIDQRDAEQVVMITSRYNTTGVIEIAGLSFERNFSVGSNAINIETLPNTVQLLGSEQIVNTGIKITSQDPISVYIHQFSGMRSEATLVLPVSALGSSHYIMSYEGISANRGVGVSEFAIVATEDDTDVSYTLSDMTENNVGPDETATIILNAGDCYQVRGANRDTDLTGTSLISSRPIAVFAGSSWSGVPQLCRFYDNLLEQMPPVESWGNEFVSAPTIVNPSDYDRYRILSASDNNDVVIRTPGGILPGSILNAGDFMELQTGLPLYITADEPIMVGQYLVGADCTSNPFGDPSYLILNSVKQLRDTVIMFNSSLEDISENYISIITLTSEQDAVQLDGVPVTGWQEIDDYSYVVERVASGSHIVTSTGCGVIASAFGLGQMESYAYGGGASFARINASPLPDGGCLGSSVIFDSDLPEERYEVTWDIGDGVAPITTDRLEHTYSDLGVFPATATIFDKCFETTEVQEKDILVTLRQSVTVGDDVAVCDGTDVVLEAIDSGIDVPMGGRLTYEWSGPQEFAEVVESTNLLIENTNTLMSGYYKVRAVVSGCPTFYDSINVDIHPFPEPDLGPDTVYCDADNLLDLTLDAGVYEEYLWNENSTGRFLEIEEEGIYSVVVADDIGCEGSDSIELIEQCPTRIYLPNVLLFNDALNGEFGILGTDVTSAILEIYDRWGNLVFRTEDINEKWNGRIDGRAANQGVYTYVIDYVGFDEEAQEIRDKIAGSIFLIK